MDNSKHKVTILVDLVMTDHKGVAYSYVDAFNMIDYNCNSIAFTVNPKFYSYSRLFPVVHNKYISYCQKEVIRRVKSVESQLIFVIKGFYLLPETIEQIKQMGKTIICFNPDDPFSNIAGSSNAFIKESISHYDAYFIWHKKLIPKLEKAGCKNVFYLPFAADTNLMMPERNYSSTVKKYAVGFIGNADKERYEFIDNLSAQLKGWNEKKAVFGSNWKSINGFDCYDIVYGNHFLDSMYNTKINLNILRKQNKGSHNMRTFDIPATGGFMLHEYSEEAADFFVEGVEAEFFRDAAECADKIKYYFKNDIQREKIALAGYEKTFSAGYTYSNLVKVIVEQLKSIV